MLFYVHCICKCMFVCFREEILLKTDSGYPKDAEVTLFNRANPGNSLRLTPIGQLHQSLPSPIPGDLERCPSHQSHVTRTWRDVWTGPHPLWGSSREQRKPSMPASTVFYGYTESATSGTSWCLIALPGRKFVLDSLGWKKINQRTYYSYTTTAWWLSTLECN